MSSWTDGSPPGQHGGGCFGTMASGAIFLVILFVTFTLVASCLFGGSNE